MRQRTVIAILSASALFVALGFALLVSGWMNPVFRLGGPFPPSPTPPPTPAAAELPTSLTPKALDTVTFKPGLTTAEIASAWQQVEDEAAEVSWQPWAVVQDADTGETLFDANSATGHTPASTMKTLTAYFALSTLQPDKTLSTGISQVGDELFLWGEGDLLLQEQTGDPQLVNGRAGLLDLSMEASTKLKEQKITEVELVYQDQLFGAPLRNPSWEKQDVANYAGDVAPFALDTGRVEPGGWQFVENSAKEVAEAVAEQLNDQGIKVTAIRPGAVPANAATLASAQSAPLADQIEYMLRVSDNTLAEQHCHLAAATTNSSPSFKDSTTALFDFLKAQGVSVDGLVVADCSGLDGDSKVSAQTLVDVLRTSAASNSSASSLVRLLPVGGLNGTLGGRFAEDAVRGNVVAKTGTLGSVAALSGVLTTASGQNLVFAVGGDNVPDLAGAYIRPYLDAFLLELARF